MSKQKIMIRYDRYKTRRCILMREAKSKEDAEKIAVLSGDDIEKLWEKSPKKLWLDEHEKEIKEICEDIDRE